MKRLLAVVLPLISISVSAQQISLRAIATGLSSPVGVAHTNDSRLFIVQQGGTIVIYDGIGIIPTPFLDIHTIISCCGERGLLGLAFHPQYATNGFFYVYYTAIGSGDINIARYHVSANPNVADASSATILLTISHSEFSNHNGGQLQFGPDGYLYAGVGDGGSGGDPHGNGQNTNVLLGKLLRLDVDHGSPYIPATNPFVGQSGKRGEIWAYGLRNPWRFSFDRQNGDLLIADVGQGLYEEIDYQPAANSGGVNYGWNTMEGFHCYNATSCDMTGLTLPIIEYGHTNGACSVTGGYRYRGSSLPQLVGSYFYGDYCNGVIWGATQMQNGSWTSSQLYDAPFNISSFGEDVNGELYVVDYGGRLLAIDNPLPTAVTATATSAGNVHVAWTAIAGATGYEVWRSADHVTYTIAGTTAATSLESGASPATSYLYKVRGVSGPTPGPFGPVDLATTVVFTDDPLGAGVNVKADHMRELRTAVNAVRVLAGVGEATFTDSTITAGFTPIRAVHLNEIRTRLSEARSALSLPPISYTDSPAEAGVTPIRALHFTEVRDGVK